MTMEDSVLLVCWLTKGGILDCLLAAGENWPAVRTSGPQTGGRDLISSNLTCSLGRSRLATGWHFSFLLQVVHTGGLLCFWTQRPLPETAKPVLFPQTKAEPSAFWALTPQTLDPAALLAPAQQNAHNLTPPAELELAAALVVPFFRRMSTQQLTTEASSVPPAPLSSTEPRDCWRDPSHRRRQVKVRQIPSLASFLAWELRLLVPVPAGIVPLRVARCAGHPLSQSGVCSVLASVGSSSTQRHPQCPDRRASLTLLLPWDPWVSFLVVEPDRDPDPPAQCPPPTAQPEAHFPPMQWSSQGLVA